MERPMNEFKKFCTGILMYGKRIQMLKFADDVTVISPNKANL